jgi:hypothetical protein
MIRINPIELPVHHKPEALKKKILSLLKVREQDLKSYEIVRRSLDARNKKDIRYSYMVDAEVRGEEKILKSAGNSKVTRAVRVPYVIPPRGREIMTSRPVIIGTGPRRPFRRTASFRMRILPGLTGTRGRCRKKICNRREVLGNRNSQSGIQCLLRRGRCRDLQRRKTEHARKRRGGKEREGSEHVRSLRSGSRDPLSAETAYRDRPADSDRDFHAEGNRTSRRYREIRLQGRRSADMRRLRDGHSMCGRKRDKKPEL